MSGDVRKRREKKRKKEELADDVGHLHVTPPQTTASDDVNIHIHKESTTGGGICAKFVFFILLAILAVLIGLIITEHRGLTDLDTVDTTSRFSQLFDGWVEEKGHADDHDEEALEHSEEVSHEEDDGEADDHDDEEEDDHAHESQEEEDDDEEEEKESDENEPEDSTVVEDETAEESVQEDESVPEEENDEDEDEPRSDEQQSDTPISEEDEEEEEDVENTEEEQRLEATEEESAEEDGEPSEDQEKQSQEEQSPEEQNEESDEAAEEEEKVIDKQEDDSAEPSDNDDEDDKETNISENEGDNEEPAETEVTKDEPDAEVEENTETIGVAKIGVGAALLIVAYIVLIRKWKNVTGDNLKIQDGKDKEIKDETVLSPVEENITSTHDDKIKEQLDTADEQINVNPNLAHKLFQNILDKIPTSSRAMYGIARCSERRLELNPTLELAWETVNNFLTVLKTEEVTDALYIDSANRAIKTLKMIGKYSLIITIQQWLIDRFPKEIDYKNQLVVTYLTVNKIPEARNLLHKILNRWPNDGFALVHYGFILKTVDNDMKLAIDYLKRGIETKEPGVIDGRFYFHLGDAFARIGQQNEATKVYEDGVKNKLFLSKYQRSLYNVERLRGKPWWELNETPYNNFFNILERHWKQIRAEGLAVLNEEGDFKDESENLKDMGDWKQFELFARGMKNKENCKKCPFTCSIVEALPDARNCKRGQVKFSVMHPGTHVWPHCGPTNCRLRAHLGLKVPPNTFIRVAEETRSWKEGKTFIFDDSFEHEVWHNGTELRLVLIVDVWHPDLTATEKKNLRPI